MQRHQPNMTSTMLKSVSATTINYYDTHAKEYCDLTRHIDLADAYDRFLVALPPDAHILDAGCGSGRDTKIFLERGYKVTAIDASLELARLAAGYTNLPSEVLRFQDMTFRGMFDGIWACASLLHISKNEMRDVVSRCVQALKPEGILYVSLKEGEGERIADDGRFFSDYTRASFEGLLQNFPILSEIAFWQSEEIRHDNSRQSWLSFLLKKSG
jgi:2-polyprenyl-3-methyl-5-hydroxy-6-metoxy-1,4-benzoquinol methylase